MRNGNFLKICVSEIRVKRIRVNQRLGVYVIDAYAMKLYFGGSTPMHQLQLCTAYAGLENEWTSGPDLEIRPLAFWPTMIFIVDAVTIHKSPVVRCLNETESDI